MKPGSAQKASVSGEAKLSSMRSGVSSVGQVRCVCGAARLPRSAPKITASSSTQRPGSSRPRGASMRASGRSSADRRQTLTSPRHEGLGRRASAAQRDRAGRTGSRRRCGSSPAIGLAQPEPPAGQRRDARRWRAGYGVVQPFRPRQHRRGERRDAPWSRPAAEQHAPPAPAPRGSPRPRCRRRAPRPAPRTASAARRRGCRPAGWRRAGSAAPRRAAAARRSARPGAKVASGRVAARRSNSMKSNSATSTVSAASIASTAPAKRRAT